MYAKTKQENKRGKSISLYCAATFAAFLTVLSCTGNSDRDEIPEGKLAISLEPSSLALTKAGTSFDEWDMIGLSVVGWLDGKEQDLTGIRNEDNVCYMCSSGSFIPDSSPAYYPDRTTKCTFYSYYPHKSKGFEKDSNDLPVEVKSDQNSYYDYKGSDYMVAVERNITPSTAPVPMKFSHILSRVTINLIAGEGCTVPELKKMEVTLKSLFSKAVYDVEKKSFSDLSVKSDIKANTISSHSISNGLGGISAIVVPQTFRAGESLFYLGIYDKTLAYKPSGELVFESGKDNVFNVTVTITNMGPSVSVSSEIKDWSDGGTVTGMAEEESKFKGTVNDIEGHTYPYVEIDGIYWFAKNLYTTKLNDGTAIEFREGGNADWMKLETPAYTYFKNIPENLTKLGALYNYKVVETGKLCPAGWRVPTKAELAALVDEENGYGTVDVPTLISPEWTGMKATNETGFSAMPGGMAMEDWLMNECYLWSSTVDETATSNLKCGYLYLSNYPWTDFHMPQVGMAVRCVKDK